jgi:hypothetical protein
VESFAWRRTHADEGDAAGNNSNRAVGEELRRLSSSSRWPPRGARPTARRSAPATTPRWLARSSPSPGDDELWGGGGRELHGELRRGGSVSPIRPAAASGSVS